MDANYGLLFCPDPSNEDVSELLALSVTYKDTLCEITDCFAGATRAIQEVLPPTYHCHCSLKLTVCVIV